MFKKNKSRRHSGSYSKSAVKTRNRVIGVLVIGIIGIGITVGVGWQFGWFAPISIPDSTINGDTSSIALISYADREDVSNFVKVDVWVPKSTAEFEDYEDILTLSNYELLGTTKQADLISIDFSVYDYIIIEIDPDGDTAFSNEFHLIMGGVNYDYTLNIYHLASDMNFNMLDITTMGAVTVADYQTDGNYSVLFDVPHHTETDIHANDDPNWAVSEDDWDDMTATEKEVYYDEANFRCEAVLYDPTVASTAAKQNMDLKFADITETFAFKITCNDTVGSDDSVTGLNITIDDDNVNGNVYRINSGVYIYLVFDSNIKFTYGIQQLGLEIEFGANITLSNMHSGRLTIPSHLWDTTGLAFSALSAIGA